MNTQEALEIALKQAEFLGDKTIIDCIKFALAQSAQDFFERGKEIAKWADKRNEQPAQEPVALLEELSNLEHQQWMKWAQSIIDSEPISEARKQRWDTMMVDYKDLPNNIQEYDREWARKVLAITHPAPSWQGLSDDEIFDLHHKWIMNSGNKDTQYDFARAIEQALKEKNT